MKVICVGRNYVKHAKELNNPIPKTPLIFFKPDTAVLRNNTDFYYPEFTKNLHFECELVYRISREGKFISERFVHTYLDGIGLGIDFTARDVQQECKKKGWPWTLAKGFNGAAPVSKMLPISRFPNRANIRFSCNINGAVRQQGHSLHQIFSIEYLVSYISRYITLKKGDLIFTGTPAGVGEVKVGDHIEAYLEGQQMLDFYVR